MHSPRSGTRPDGSGHDRAVWLFVSAAALAAISWMGYEAVRSPFNAMLLALLGAVAALLIGSIAAISWGRKATRRAEREPRLLVPAVVAVAVGWFGFAVALFVAFSFLQAEQVLRRFFAS